MANANANQNANIAGSNLLAGTDFEVSWVIRGTEWSQGSVPTGWQAISNQVASGSGLSGHAAQDLISIQREVQTKADQT